MVGEALEAQVALDARAALGEGPVWDDRASRLIWVDILAGRVHRFDPATGEDSWSETGSPVGAVAPRASGGLVMALEEGFALTTDHDATPSLVAPVGADRDGIRFNDGKCDPAGRFWAGTMAYDGTPAAGSLYRFDADLRVRKMASGVTISNGLAWSSDGRTMYFIDSLTLAIDAFDFDTDAGALRDRRRIIEVPKEAGMPDGMTIDAHGGLWVALWGGWAVCRYLPDGTLDRVVKVPAQQVTSCAFGGPDLADLYVTSAREGLSEPELVGQPYAGAVFVCRPGLVGVPADRFAG